MLKGDVVIGKKTVIVGILLMLIFGFTASGEEKPPLSGQRVAGEILAGVTGGSAAVIAGAAILGRTFPASDDDSWEAVAVDFLVDLGLAYIVCYPLASSVAVYLVGSVGAETGSFWATLGSDLLGAVFGALGGLTLAEGSPEVGIALLFAGPVIGATIGFNRTRRYKSPAESETALVNFQNGQMSLAVPRIHFRVDTFGRRALSQNIDLLRVRF